MKIQVDPKYRSFYYQDVETYPELNLDPKTTALLLVDLQNEFANNGRSDYIEKRGHLGPLEVFPRPFENDDDPARATPARLFP